jgi:hypothetical protein
MKQYYLPIIICMIAFVSCKSKNNNIKTNATKLVDNQLYDIKNANGIDTNNYETYATYTEGLSVFGSKYILQFNSNNQMFRFVNTCDTNICNNIKLQQLEYGKWKILKLKILKDDFKQEIIIKDINLDQYNDVIVKHRLNSNVYLYNPSYSTFSDTVNYTINHIGPFEVDVNNNLYCDFRYLKYNNGEVASELYYLNGLTKTKVYQMVFAATDSVTNANLKNSVVDKFYLQKFDSTQQIIKTDTIKIKPLVCNDEFHEYFKFVEYWKKNYMKLLNIKYNTSLDRAAIFSEYWK